MVEKEASDKHMNPIEVVSDIFKPFLDREKKPLNVLEVGNLWLYCAIAENSLRNEQSVFNIVQDKELKEKLKIAAEDVHNPIMQDIVELFKSEGISLPNPTADKPFGDYRYIPEGAKLTDEEAANLMSFNLVIGLTYGMRGLSESIRADVGLIFSKAIIRKMAFSITLKDLMIKRGWIKIPPYFKV